MLEQNCLYPECDDKDLLAHHLFVKGDGRVLAYARLLPQGISYDGASSIGRVVVAQEIRNRGMGRTLMEHAIQRIGAMYTSPCIRISAQAHLAAFYSSLGFVQESETYLEDGIPHVEMAYYAREA